MAVPEQTPYKEFTANGISKVFPLEFDVLEQDHLIVLVNDLEPTVGSWSLDTQNDTVVFALPPANGANIKIRRDSPLSRSTDYESYNNSFRPKPVNDDLDNIWRKLQEMGVLNWMIDNNIKDLNEYVDGLNDKTKAQFLDEIQKQGISLNQLEDFTNQIYQNLANVAASKGWFAEFVADGNENQKEINDKTLQSVESIEKLKILIPRRNGQQVHLKSVHEGLNKGSGDFFYDAFDVSNPVNGFIVKSFFSNTGRWKRSRKNLHTIEDFGGISDFDIETETGADDSDALQASLDFLSYAYITAPTKITKPIYMKKDQALYRTDSSAVIAKTSNTKGIGSNLAPARSLISDSYNVDAGIILKHEDNLYTTSVEIDVDLVHMLPTKDSIGIYAPRFYLCNFKGKVQRFGVPIATYDGFNSKVELKMVGSAYGPRWMNDGSGSMTGTTIDFSNSWVVFDSTHNEPIKGFDLYQLWYSGGNNVGVDNGIRADEQVFIAYDFDNCKALIFNGGAENNKGVLVRAKNTQAEFNGFKTANNFGGSFINFGTITAINSRLSFSNTQFDQTQSPGLIKDIITDGSTVRMASGTRPSGGSGTQFLNNGVLSIADGLSDKVYLSDEVQQIKDGKFLSKKQATGYTSLFRVFTDALTPCVIDLLITVKTDTGFIHKNVTQIFTNNSGSIVVNQKINNTMSSGTIADFALVCEASGNVYLETAEVASARFKIETSDTYIHGNSNTFLTLY